jgi:hypothetical protein
MKQFKITKSIFFIFRWVFWANGLSAAAKNKKDKKLNSAFLVDHQPDGHLGLLKDTHLGAMFAALSQRINNF